LAHLTSSVPEAHEKRFGFSPKALRVYEEVAIRVLFKSVPPRDGKEGVVRYQACTDDACLPPARIVHRLIDGVSHFRSSMKKYQPSFQRKRNPVWKKLCWFSSRSHRSLGRNDG
jgi:hypothetical protein